MAPEDSKDWGVYRYYVVEELKRINDTLEKVAAKLQQFRDEDIAQLRTDVALLKFQALLVGGVASAIVSIVVAVVARAWK